MITKTEKDFIQIIVMFGVFVNLLWFVGCASITKTVYLWDGDILRVEGESGLIVNIREGYTEIQSGHAILKSGEKVIVGQPEKYIDQWNRWGTEEWD